MDDEMSINNPDMEVSRKRCEDVEIATVRAELELANEKLHSSSITDSLSGLASARSFGHRLEDEFRRALRYQSPFSLVWILVDDSGDIEQDSGREFADHVVKGCAELVTQVIRDTDLAGRVGDYEFALILTCTDSVGARMVGERVCAKVASAAWLDRAITVSVGACTFNLGVESPRILTERAQSTAQFARNRGGNQMRDYWELHAACSKAG